MPAHLLLKKLVYVITIGLQRVKKGIYKTCYRIYLIVPKYIRISLYKSFNNSSFECGVGNVAKTLLFHSRSFMGNDVSQSKLTTSGCNI
jgi:hypothetical protein